MEASIRYLKTSLKAFNGYEKTLVEQLVCHDNSPIETRCIKEEYEYVVKCIGDLEFKLQQMPEMAG